MKVVNLNGPINYKDERLCVCPVIDHNMPRAKDLESKVGTAIDSSEHQETNTLHNSNLRGLELLSLLKHDITEIISSSLQHCLYQKY